MEFNSQILAKNLIEYRKQAGLTQLELSEKINYSDKSISKWECGDGIPDLEVLFKICNLYHITLNDLCYEHTNPTTIVTVVSKAKKLGLISALSVTLTWLVAVSIFVLLSVLNLGLTHLWLCFVYAVPVTFIVLLVFNILWGKPILSLFWESGIVWSVILSLFLSMPFTNMYYLFYIGIPLQIMAILWYFHRKNKVKV